MDEEKKGFIAEAIPPFYPATNYDEPYRGQYHFSSQSGWMNDINGIWYWDGIYYMTYQTTPSHHEIVLEEHSIGMAVSPDMVRWEQKPLALRPSSLGSVFSGSVVVDLHNASGFQTGANPVFVGFYSYTESGVCIAYSNDLGVTWQGYEGNPVIPAIVHDTRDPHVLWHGASKKWCLAIYGPGDGATSFYSSCDMKEWKFESQIDYFGFECPDLFELPVDGDVSNKKWVLIKADGQYLLGQFDGSVYTPDSREALDSVHGGCFYASQTFFKDTFPDNRVVQLAWMGNPTDSVFKPRFTTSPWNQCATFPVELKLEKRPEGIRLTRNPISEIQNIHDETLEWGGRYLLPGDNLFSEVSAKCCDITAEFDLADAEATEIVFGFADKTVRYDIEKQALMGKPCLPVSNRVGLRILTDWSQIEVFSCGGVFSWAERYFFAKDRNDIRLSVNGRIKLVSLTVHKLRLGFEKMKI